MKKVSLATRLRKRAEAAEKRAQGLNDSVNREYDQRVKAQKELSDAKAEANQARATNSWRPQDVSVTDDIIRLKRAT